MIASRTSGGATFAVGSRGVFVACEVVLALLCWLACLSGDGFGMCWRTLDEKDQHAQSEMGCWGWETQTGTQGADTDTDTDTGTGTGTDTGAGTGAGTGTRRDMQEP
eukprot:1963132-Rhodomonas_salina.3